MQSSPRVAVIAFDAMDAALMSRMVRAGQLPTMASLFETAAWSPTINPTGLLVGGVWPSFATGSTPGRHGFYCYRQLVNHTYDVRRFTPDDIVMPPVWRVLCDAGRRCAVIDAPITTPTAELNGIQLVEWGVHDRIVPFASSPDALAREVVERFGNYPVARCDHYTQRGDPSGLRADLLRGIETKTRLARHFLEQGPWDLFFVAHNESHCAGHQFWRIHDPAHPGHDPKEQALLGDPLEDVYRALDVSLEGVLGSIDGTTAVMVFLSHGMGPHYDGDHLLGEILTRLDDADSRSPQWIVWREIALRQLGRRRRSARGAVSLDGSRRFYKVPNNELYGGIRVNLVGREPRGRVRPGPELEELIAYLRAELCALTDPDSGRPIVRDVLRTDELYEGGARDALPDLLVDWHRDAPISGARSSTIGTVRGDYEGLRTGDHRPSGWVFARGPGIAPGPLGDRVRVIDLAPTIAAWLGVELPDVDGRPIPAFARLHT